MFDCEYWPLEQAKLGAAQGASRSPGQIAADHRRRRRHRRRDREGFAAAGAEVALLDVDLAAAREQAKAIGAPALALACDVTDAASVSAAFDKIAEHFGGVDIVVSNAGAAWQGRIGEVDEDILRKSFELNFYGHQRVAQAAVKIMLRARHRRLPALQRLEAGGQSGTEFRALWHSESGGAGSDAPICARLRRRRHPRQCGQCRPHPLRPAHAEMIASRAKARGVSEKDYMSGNLLGREVTAEDVAQAFLHQALALKTTADVTTVDGGNIAAAMR